MRFVHVLLTALLIVSTFGFISCAKNQTPLTSQQTGKTLTIINEWDFPLTLYFSLDFGRHFGHKCEVDANGTALTDINDLVWLVDSLVDSDEEINVLVVGVFPDSSANFLGYYTWEELMVKQFVIRLTNDVPTTSTVVNQVHFKTIAEAQEDTPFTIITPKHIPSSLKLEDICINYQPWDAKAFYYLSLVYRSPNSWVSISENEALWEIIPVSNQITCVTYGDIQVTKVFESSGFHYHWNTSEVGIDVIMDGISDSDANAIVKSMIL